MPSDKQPSQRSNNPPEQDRLIKSAYGVLQRLLKNLRPKYELRADQVESIVLDALKQHGAHLATHGIEQKNLDGFKLACWLGGSLLELEKEVDDRCEVIIDGLLKTLREFLIEETQWKLIMPKSSIVLLKSLLIQERKNNPKHGIWMNGLYVAFYCSLKSWREGKAYQIPL